MDVRDRADGKTQEEILYDISGDRSFTRQTYQGQEVRVKAIAFSEHDTINPNINNIVELGKERGVWVIPAVELDCETNRFEEIHLNCFLFGDLIERVLADEEFTLLLKSIESGRRETCAIMISELKRHGYLKSDIDTEDITSKQEIYGLLRNPDASHIAEKFANNSDVRKWSGSSGYLVRRQKPNAFAVAHQIARRLKLPFSIEHSRKIRDKHTDSYILNRDRKELIKSLTPWAIQIYYPYIADNSLKEKIDLTECLQTEWELEDLHWLEHGSGEIIIPTGGSDFHGTSKKSKYANRIGECFTPWDHLKALERAYKRRSQSR
jgi:hypothetical protein